MKRDPPHPPRIRKNKPIREGPGNGELASRLFYALTMGCSVILFFGAPRPSTRRPR